MANMVLYLILKSIQDILSLKMFLNVILNIFKHLIFIFILFIELVSVILKYKLYILHVSRCFCKPNRHI